jgi:hypothetical protein
MKLSRLELFFLKSFSKNVNIFIPKNNSMEWKVISFEPTIIGKDPENEEAFRKSRNLINDMIRTYLETNSEYSTQELRNFLLEEIKKLEKGE